MAPSATPELLDLAIGKLHPDPNNPRKRVEVDEDFVASIKEHGILQPIIVRPADKTGEYVICFGERRYTGAKKAGLKKVPALVHRELDPITVFEQQVIENIHRQGLTPLEEARAYVALVDDHKLPQRELVKKLGRSQSYLSKHMSLALRLPLAGQDLLDADQITVSDAILLASMHEAPDRIAKVIAAYKSGRTDWQSGPNILRSELAAWQAEKKVKAAEKQLTDAGVKLLDRPMAWRNRLGADMGVDIEPDAHADETCHAGAVYSDGTIGHYCLDPDRHGPDGDSQLKAPRLMPQEPSDDPENPIGDFAAGVERGATGTGQPENLIEGKPAAEWREEQQKKTEKDLAERQQIVATRRSFIRELLGADWTDRPDGFRLIASTLVMAAVDEGDWVWGSAALALELLGGDPVSSTNASALSGMYLNDTEAALMTHADPFGAALAAALAIAEAKIDDGQYTRWTGDTFAADPIVRHFEFLQTHGYVPHQREADLLAAGRAIREARVPHAFQPSNDSPAECSTCQATVDHLLDDGVDAHTNRAELEAAGAAPDSDGNQSSPMTVDDPVLDEYLAARGALEVAKAKPTRTKKGMAALVDTFEAARLALLSRVAEALAGVLVDAAGVHDALDAADLGHLNHVIQLTPKPATTVQGAVLDLHADEILEAVPSHQADDFAAECGWAIANLPEYFEVNDDQAVEKVAEWTAGMDPEDTARLLRIEETNADALDRPFLRAALAKVIDQGRPVADVVESL